MLLQYIEYQFVIRALYDGMTWSGKKEQFSCVPIATLHFSLKNRPPLIPLCGGGHIRSPACVSKYPPLCQPHYRLMSVSYRNRVSAIFH